MSSFIFSKHSHKNLLIAMTTRFGGVSCGAYTSLNLGVNTDDDKSNIYKNYDIVKSGLAIERLVKLNQVHGDIIHEVTASNYNDVDMSDGDGLFTVDSGVALAVLTADCFPVVLVGEIGVAVLHCGWRSLNSSIIESAVKIFNRYDDRVSSVFVGAGISEDEYTVKDDMVERLDKRYTPERFLTTVGEGEYRLNLQGLLINALDVNGLTDIDILNSTTQDDRFFSYRRDNGITGRMATVVMRR